jgi:hypothetical protein
MSTKKLAILNSALGKYAVSVDIDVTPRASAVPTKVNRNKIQFIISESEEKAKKQKSSNQKLENPAQGRKKYR